jgi:hypothetical protein
MSLNLLQGKGISKERTWVGALDYSSTTGARLPDPIQVADSFSDLFSSNTSAMG